MEVEGVVVTVQLAAPREAPRQPGCRPSVLDIRLAFGLLCDGSLLIHRSRMCCCSSQLLRVISTAHRMRAMGALDCNGHMPVRALLAP